MKIFYGLFIVLLLYANAANSEPSKVIYPVLDKVKSGLDMVFVKSGTFTMGGQDHADDGGPQGGADADECPHTVTVLDFYIGKYEVTQADWIAIMGENPSSFRACRQCPVEQVSWDDVQIFIKKLNIKFDATYRLPTEAEWEFAARGGIESQGYRYAGSNELKEVAWYRKNSGNKPHPVGRLKPNELEIYDMSGNIWEWCSVVKTPYPCNPDGMKFNSKVLRGGTWSHTAQSIRTKDRNARASYQRLPTLGFRLAK
jgi:formylglycine-generating enzyme